MESKHTGFYEAEPFGEPVTGEPDHYVFGLPPSERGDEYLRQANQAITENTVPWNTPGIYLR